MAGQVGPVCLCVHEAACVHSNVLPASVSLYGGELWSSEHEHELVNL